MNFKCFITEKKKERFNIGDTMEGVFAIAIGLYIAYREIDRSELISSIKDVNISKEGPVTVNIIDDIERSTKVMDDVEDAAEEIGVEDEIDTSSAKIGVKVWLNLKYDQTHEGFGDKFDITKRKDVSNYKEVIDSMIYQINSPTMVMVKDKIDRFIAQVLSNNEDDDKVMFLVKADGVGNSSKEDENGLHVKGDVDITIEAELQNGKKQINVPSISFSLKVDNKTFANLGIYNAIAKLGHIFGTDDFLEGMVADAAKGGEIVPSRKASGDKVDSYVKEKDPNGKIITGPDKENKLLYYMKTIDDLMRGYREWYEESLKLMSKFTDSLKENLSNLSKKEKITRTYKFLINELTGSQKSDVIKISKSDDFKHTTVPILKERAKYFIESEKDIEVNYTRQEINTDGDIGKCFFAVDLYGNNINYMDFISHMNKKIKKSNNPERILNFVTKHYEIIEDQKKDMSEKEVDEQFSIVLFDRPTSDKKSKIKIVADSNGDWVMGYIFDLKGNSDEKKDSEEDSGPRGYINFYAVDNIGDKEKLFHIRRRKDQLVLEVEDDAIY